MVQLTSLPLSAFANIRAEVGRQPSDSRTLTSDVESVSQDVFYV